MHGSIEGGTLITINGTGFGNMSSEVNVFIGGKTFLFT